MEKRIAVLGKMRSGKDTLAEVFTDYEEMKFSDGISEIIDNYFPHAWDEGKPREHYQKIGQWLRELDDEVWINHLEKRLHKFELGKDDSEKKVIITDVRQENEVKWLQDHGFVIIKVEASDETRKQRIIDSGDVFDESMFNHETEQGIDEMPCDLVVNNDSCSLEEFKALSLEIYNKLKGDN